MDNVYLTREGFEKLRSELAHLVKVVCPEATKELATAREHGDLSENAEYDAARENLAEINRQIKELQVKLSKVEIINHDELSVDEVRIFSRVTLLNVKDDARVTYTLVDPLQSDPTKGRISMKSPIGKGLLGKKIGDEIKIEVPSGTIHLRVLEIDIETEI